MQVERLNTAAAVVDRAGSYGDLARRQGHRAMVEMARRKAYHARMYRPPQGFQKPRPIRGWRHKGCADILRSAAGVPI